MNQTETEVDLRIKGKIVTRCCVDYAFSLEFYEKHERTVIRIWGRMDIDSQGTRLRLSAEKPTESAQACLLFGKTIQNAVGRKDGSLGLSLTDGSRLTVPYDENFEAWEASADDGFLVVSLSRRRTDYMETSMTASEFREAVLSNMRKYENAR